MKLFKLDKDGGPKSRVWGYFAIEWKRVFSIVLLNFKDGSREAYHSHAFHSVSWVLRGKLTEERIDGDNRGTKVFKPSLIPVITTRNNFHKVTSEGGTWVLNFRGPWREWWEELDENNEYIMLTHGRKVVT